MAATDSKRTTIAKALHAVAQEAKSEKTPIRRVSIQILDSGEVTFRLHPADGGEYIGGVVRPESS